MTNHAPNSAAVAHRDRVLAQLGLPASIFNAGPSLAALRALTWHRMMAKPMPLGNRISIAEIAEATGHAHSTVSQAISKLEHALSDAREVMMT